MPVEDVWKYKGATRGAIPSRKLGRPVHWRSTLARDYSRLLEYNQQVLTYEELPFKIEYRWKEELCQCIPDFLVQYQNGCPTIAVCLWTKYLQDPAHRADITATRLWCQRKRCVFTIVTEETIQKHTIRIRNLEQLAVHAHQTFEPPVIEYLLRTITAAPQPLSLPEIIQFTPHVPAKLIPGAVWHLLAIGLLTTDLDQPLHVVNTRIWWEGGTHVAE